MTRVIKTDYVAVDEQSGLLRVRDFAAEARDVVLNARRDAAKIISQARKATAELCGQSSRQAYAEGFARGQKDGYEEGLKQAAERKASDAEPSMTELSALAKEAIKSIDAARRSMRADFTGQMLEFAMELAGKVVGRVAAIDVEAAKLNLAKVLEISSSFGRLSVHVNPAQVEPLRQYCGQVIRDLHAGGQVELVADASVSPGGAKAVGGAAEVDATVQTQWTAVVDAIVGPAGREKKYGRIETEPPPDSASADYPKRSDGHGAV